MAFEEKAMRMVPLLLSVAVPVLLVSPVAAQPSSGANDSVSPGSRTFSAEAFIGRRDPGTLRASDFVGREVYGRNNEAIGEVNDVLFGPDGRISGLVIEVGGTFGISEREVALPIHAFQIDPATTATTGTIGGLPPSTEAGVDARQHNRTSSVVVPERIVLPVPPEMLRSAPPFEDPSRHSRKP
jgi:sporulation protein YlmC with PRC-barrel domain